MLVVIVRLSPNHSSFLSHYFKVIIFLETLDINYITSVFIELHIYTSSYSSIVCFIFLKEMSYLSIIMPHFPSAWLLYKKGGTNNGTSTHYSQSGRSSLYQYPVLFSSVQTFKSSSTSVARHLPTAFLSTSSSYLNLISSRISF